MVRLSPGATTKPALSSVHTIENEMRFVNPLNFDKAHSCCLGTIASNEYLQGNGGVWNICIGKDNEVTDSHSCASSCR